MRNFAIIIGSLLMTPITYGQIDFSKLNKAARQFNQIQKQVNQFSQNRTTQQSGNQQPKQGGYNLDPNSSGDQNRGGFDRNRFGPPRNNFGPPQRSIPGQNYQPGNTYPGNNVYPGRTFPGGTIPQSNMNPSGTIIRDGIIYQNGQVIGSTLNSNRIPFQNGTSSAINRSVVNGYNGLTDPPLAAPIHYSGRPIVIRCNESASGICNYKLITAKGSVFPYTIAKGQKQSLTETTAWVLQYKATPNSPESRYRLKGGKIYEMRRSASGWQLYMVP